MAYSLIPAQLNCWTLSSPTLFVMDFIVIFKSKENQISHKYFHIIVKNQLCCIYHCVDDKYLLLNGLKKKNEILLSYLFFILLVNTSGCNN